VVEGQFEVDIWFKDRGLRFLDLEKKGIVTVDTLQNEHPTSGPDTSDAHHLVRKVDEFNATAAPCDRNAQ
jgi:hypothetical protein